VLDELVKYGYIERKDGEYVIPDPVVRRAVIDGLKF